MRLASWWRAVRTQVGTYNVPAISFEISCESRLPLEIWKEASRNTFSLVRNIFDLTLFANDASKILSILHLKLLTWRKSVSICLSWS